MILQMQRFISFARALQQKILQYGSTSALQENDKALLKVLSLFLVD